MYKLVFIFGFLSFSCLSEQSKPEQTQSLQDGDKGVFIFDQLFSPKVISAYFDLVTAGQISGKISSWFYTYSDYYQNFGTLNSSTNSPWIAPVNPEFFASTSLWNISRSVVEKLSGGKKYFPYDVCFSMQRRLDFITATSKGKMNIYFCIVLCFFSRRLPQLVKSRSGCTELCVTRLLKDQASYMVTGLFLYNLRSKINSFLFYL